MCAVFENQAKVSFYVIRSVAKMYLIFWGVQKSASAILAILARKFKWDIVSDVPTQWQGGKLIGVFNNKKALILSAQISWAWPSRFVSLWKAECSTLHFFFGFAGLGICLVRDSNSSMLGQYFKKKRALVEMILGCSSGLGLPLISQFVWRAIK